jgi:hypothetical protein
VADAIRGNYDSPGAFTDSLAAQASRFGLRRGDGLGVMRWLLDIVGDPGTPRWLDEATAHVKPESAQSKKPGPAPSPDSLIPANEATG